MKYEIMTSDEVFTVEGELSATTDGRLAVHDMSGKLTAVFAPGQWVGAISLGESQPRVWGSIHDVPEGVTVLDHDGDEFYWQGGELYYISAPWGTISSTFNESLGPFTEKQVSK